MKNLSSFIPTQRLEEVIYDPVLGLHLNVDTLYHYTLIKDGFQLTEGGLSFMQDTSIVVQLIPTGLQESLPEQAVKIMPNPSQGKFLLELGAGLSGEVSIQIYNNQAQIVESWYGRVDHAETLNFDIGDQAPGIYHLSINTEGNPAYNSRLVIQ